MYRSVTAGLTAGLSALTMAAFALPGGAAAAPVHNHGLTLTAEPDPVAAGQSVLIYGQLKGPDSGDQRVILYHRLARGWRFTPVGSTRTDASGFYEFVRADGIVTTNRQWFVVGPGHTHSRTVGELVSAVVSLTASTQSTTTGETVDFSGSVDPDHPDQRVVLQEQTDSFGNGWRTIARTTTDDGSNFTFAPTFRSAGDYTLRAVFARDARNITGDSPDVSLTVQQAQNTSFTITGSAPVITDGQPVTISGTLYTSGSTTAPQPGVSVTLYGKDVSGGTYRAIASTSTGPSGAYSFTQVPQYNMTYRVETGGSSPQSTAELYVGVQDVVTINSSTQTPELGQPVTIGGSVTPQHAGHVIALQELGAGGLWSDVALTRVEANSDYTFNYVPAQLGNVQLRTQIGGGPANVGADSAPVQLAVTGLAPVASLPAAPQLRG
jgi:hypothetical protein